MASELERSGAAARRGSDIGLIADANGDLFGTSLVGGANDDGAVFGTTDSGGANDDGTVFEILKTAAGYASTPITLVNFNGAGPLGSLIADATGNLFGTTDEGGANDDGTAFDITDSGFVTTATPPPTVTSDILWQNGSTGQASVWEMDGNTRVGGGAVSPNPGPAWRAVGTGAFFSGGTSDILWQNTSTGHVSVWEMNGNSRTGGGALSLDPGPTWKAIGTGDLNGDGDSDILFQNASSGQVSIWEMNGNTRTGGGVLSLNPWPAWKAIGTGDFNDDGSPTSSSGTRARARSRSWRWMGAPGSTAGRASIK